MTTAVDVTPNRLASAVGNYHQQLRGYKGGSKGTQRQPVEAPDSLISTQQIRILDLISEGEIEGLVNGLDSIFLEEAPGSSYPSLQWDHRVGTNDQPYLQGFPSVESDITVNVELQATVPYIRAVTNTTVSALRVNFSLGRFAQQSLSNGDTTGYRVDFAIDLAEGSGGAFVEILRSAFDGKSTGGYTRSIRVDLPHSPAPVGGWRVRVRRITPNSQASNIWDVVTVRSVTEIVDYKFRYPNSALVGLSFDAEAFGGKIPKRSYHIRGRIIRVPSNYDANTRTYTGVWDGTFKLSYTNNPVWIYFDLLINDRFGLGKRISAAQVDKWGLYEISRYCDQMVSDGKGGLEPRFTCNLYLQRQADALKVLQDIAAIFRGITYWGLGQAIVSADMPRDPVYTYTNANVKNGYFNRKGSKKSTIYTVILSAWNDPDDFYRTKYEYIQDDELVAKYGVRSQTLTNLGCTSQGQAQRAGRWALLTNKLEKDTVTFGVGLEGIKAMPGQVIRVVDQHRQGRRVGGRVRAGSTATEILLDMLPNAAVGVGDELVLNLPDGKSSVRGVVSVDSATNRVSVSPAFEAAPVPGAIWAYESDTLKSELYRVTSIAEGESPLDYSITALTYAEGKHDNIDFGTIISDRPTTSIPVAVVPAPQNVRMSTDWKIDQYQAVTTMTIAWDAVPDAIRYDVEWRRDNTEWVYAGRVAPTEIDVVGVYAGSYRARVRAINSLGILSPWAEIGPQQLNGKTGLPPMPVGLRTVSEVFAIRVLWGFPAGAEDTAYSEIQVASTADGQNPLDLGLVAYPTTQYLNSGMAAGVERFFRVRLRDKTGNIGPWTAWTRGISSADATEILGYITGKITETQLGQDLLSEIGKISGDGPGSVNERYKAGDTALQSQINSLSAQLADLAGAEEWVPGQAYLAGTIVKYEGKLYRAVQDTPAGTPVTNTTYWEYLGDYASIGEMVAALAVRVDGVETSVNEINGELTAMASRILGVEVAVRPRMAGATNWQAGATGAYAGAWSVYSAFAQADMAISKQVTEVKAQVDNNLARVVRQVETMADEVSAIATTTDTLTAEVGDTKAAVQVNAQAINGIDVGLKAMYNIKVGIDSNGRYYSAGMGIGVENTPSGMQSQVIFLADRYAVMQSINGLPQTFFAIENGQTVIQSAFISKAAIQVAMIGSVIYSQAVVPSGPYAGMPKLTTDYNAGTQVFRGVNYARVDSDSRSYFQSNATGVVFLEMGELS